MKYIIYIVQNTQVHTLYDNVISPLHEPRIHNVRDSKESYLPGINCKLFLFEMYSWSELCKS